MFLTFDQGNSCLKIDICTNDKKISHKWIIGNDKNLTKHPILSELNQHNFSAAIISSVVPKLTPNIITICEIIRIPEIMVIEPSTNINFINLLENPEELGTDRIATIAEARAAYNGNCLIIDMGSATTFDLLTKNGEYLGGNIAPGLESMARAIANSAALLDYIPPERPQQLLSNNGPEAIRSGLFYGYKNMIQGMVEKFQNAYPIRNEPLKIICTGGNLGLYIDELPIMYYKDGNLLMKGLVELYNINRKE